MTKKWVSMDAIDTLLDLPSPADSFTFEYNDADQYLDGTNTPSLSPDGSEFNISSFLQDVAIPNIYPSPVGSESSATGGDSPQSTSAAAKKPAAKRKRENRYKNAPPSVLSRRRAQNRASQRAYRERKDQRIKDLEAMLSEAKQKNDALSQAYTVLHTQYMKLSRPATARPDTVFNSAVGLGGNDELDMDLYVYRDMAGFPL